MSPILEVNLLKLFYKKNMILIFNKLGEVRADLQGLYYLSPLFEKIYSAILCCKFIQQTWMLYLQSKDKFVDEFQIWLPNIEVEVRYSIKTLRADKKDKFISVKLKAYCQQCNIGMKYTTLYLYKKNNLAKRRQKIVIMIKNSLLIDSGLAKTSRLKL